MANKGKSRIRIREEWKSKDKEKEDHLSRTDRKSEKDDKRKVETLKKYDMTEVKKIEKSQEG